MRIKRIIILRVFAEKIERKHHVTSDEIRELFDNHPRFRKLEKGNIAGEDLFGAYGFTDSGRYLSVFFESCTTIN